MLRRRSLLLLALVVALVGWITADAAGRATVARAAHARRAVRAAERRVNELLAEPPHRWAPLPEQPGRRPFESSGDYGAALEAARQVLAWRVAQEAVSPVSIVEHEGDLWLVQRQRAGDPAGPGPIRPDLVRARPWDPIARSIAAETGVSIDLAGGGESPFLPGLLRAGSGEVTAHVPALRGPLEPWLDMGRAVVAILAAGLLVRELLLVQHAREREVARDALLQRISHELRTPAASIRSLSDALAADAVEDPEERRQFLALLGTEVERLGVGIDRLLRAARGEGAIPAVPVPVDLVEWTHALVERWRPRLPGLQVQTPPGALVWRADPDRLDEAVEALLDNACKHGGPAVVLAVARAGDAARISVSDDGPGVPEAHRGRVLERLQRVEGRPGDPGGYGLGLWAAAEVARAHGGSLTLEGGSCFVISLPESPGGAATAPPAAGSSSGGGGESTSGAEAGGAPATPSPARGEAP